MLLLLLGEIELLFFRVFFTFAVAIIILNFCASKQPVVALL